MFDSSNNPKKTSNKSGFMAEIKPSGREPQFTATFFSGEQTSQRP